MFKTEVIVCFSTCSYCECFAAGVYCIEPCSCQDCFNKPIHEDTVLATRKQIESRNPLAFAPKVIRSSDSVPEFGVRKQVLLVSDICFISKFDFVSTC